MPHEGLCGVHFESESFHLRGRLWLAKGDHPKATVLLLHGFPGIELNLDLATALREAGWNALVFHYRGSWGSEGVYRLATLPEDIRAALTYLSSGKHPQVDPRRLFLIGHSMGGWAAVMAGAADPRVWAVGVIAGVCDMRTLHLSADVVENDIMPYLAGYSTDIFFREIRTLAAQPSPLETVKGLSGRPILVVHSRKDEVIPYSGSQALFEAAPEPKRIVIHDEANHTFAWHRDWLKKTVLAWMAEIEQRRSQWR